MTCISLFRVCLLTSMLFPSIGFTLDLSLDIPQSDKSQQYLSDIFGQMGTTLIGSGNNLLGSLFYVFNLAILSLGMLVGTYTIIVSTINTAQEGQMMGKDWSPAWIPLRAVIGGTCLLPTASGYSLIQILMMKFVLLGIAAGDQVWGQVMISVNSGTALGSITMNSSTIQQDATSLFNSMVCAQALNNDPICKSAIGNKTVAGYTSQGQYIVGIEGDPVYYNVCGGLNTSNNPPTGIDATTWQQANIAAFIAAASDLISPATEVVATDNSNQWSSINVISNAKNTLQNTIIAGAITSYSASSNALARQAGVGWLFAGSYYFDIVRSTGSTLYPAPTVLPTDTNVTNSLGACTTQLATYYTRASSYMGALSAISNASSASLNIPSSNNPLVNLVQTSAMNTTYTLLNAITTNNSDVLSSLSHVGSQILVATEALFYAVIAASALLLLIACLAMPGVQPACWAAGIVVSIFMPGLMFIILIFGGIGALLGIYVPIIPYAVYTFAALGWMILVIETIAAAPIVALGLMSPSADHLGKIAPAIGIVTNVFLRPSLMVIGFITAIKLLQAAVLMLNFAFFSTVNNAVGDIGLFGCIALVALYGGLVISIIQECFTLIYKLPDKVLRWVQGSEENTGAIAKKGMDEAKAGVEKGDQAASGLMKAGAAPVEGKAAQAVKGGGEGEGEAG